MVRRGNRQCAFGGRSQLLHGLVEKWTKDGTKVDRLFYAGNNLEKAQKIFAERHKAADPYCSLSPACPLLCVEAGDDLSDELPKKRRRTEVFVSSNWQPLVPVGWHNFGYRRRYAPWVPRAPNCIHILRAPVAPGRLAIGPINRLIQEEHHVQVLVRDNNVEPSRC
jgi:hypothetical protein